MPLRHWPARAKDLARVPLVLAPGLHAGGRVLRGAVMVAALAGAVLVGAAGCHVYWDGRLTQLQRDAVPMAQHRQAEQALTQTRLQLQMSEAHGRELEHQIDALNQRLRVCLEEVTFFRKGHEARR